MADEACNPSCGFAAPTGDQNLATVVGQPLSVNNTGLRFSGDMPFATPVRVDHSGVPRKTTAFVKGEAIPRGWFTAGAATATTTTTGVVQSPSSTGASIGPPGTLYVSGDLIGGHRFQDPKMAALFCLLNYGIPLMDFLYWAVGERSYIMNEPHRACRDPGSLWKFLLLQDQSLTSLLETVSASRTTQQGGTGGTTGSISVSLKQPGDKSAMPSSQACSTVATSSDPLPSATSADESVVQAEEVVAPPLSQTRTRRAITLTQATADGPVVPTPSPSGFVQQIGRLQVSPATSERHPSPSLTRETNRASEGGGTTSRRGARGSSRRIPEKQGVIDCPECGRRGQSIFDPNCFNDEGLVWQYFYCRNSDCPKGRSSNRYIGWATRQKTT